MNDDFSRMVAERLTSQEAKQERGQLRPWMAILAGLCLAALVVATKEAYGAEVPVHVWSDGKTTIRLMPGPCTDPVVKPFLESVGELKRFKNIESDWTYKDGQKKSHGGCWAEFSAKDTGTVAVFMMFFDDGERVVVEKSEFVKKRGQVGV